MSRIVHLALKVEDLEKTTEFYEKVFGFREVETNKTRDHLSRHLTDKFRAPGGTVAELVPVGRYKKPPKRAR